MQGNLTSTVTHVTVQKSDLNGEATVLKGVDALYIFVAQWNTRWDWARVTVMLRWKHAILMRRQRSGNVLPVRKCTNHKVKHG